MGSIKGLKPASRLFWKAWRPGRKRFPRFVSALGSSPSRH